MPNNMLYRQWMQIIGMHMHNFSKARQVFIRTWTNKIVYMLQNLYGYKLHLLLLICTQDINMLTIRKLGEEGYPKRYLNHPTNKNGKSSVEEPPGCNCPWLQILKKKWSICCLHSIWYSGLITKFKNDKKDMNHNTRALKFEDFGMRDIE
jgi:hypothetical protein